MASSPELTFTFEAVDSFTGRIKLIRIDPSIWDRLKAYWTKANVERFKWLNEKL